MTDEVTQKTIETQKTESDRLLGQLQVFKIQSNQHETVVAGMLLQARERQGILETLKETVTAPLNQALNAARSLFKPAEDSVSMVVERLRALLVDWNTSKEELRKQWSAVLANPGSPDQFRQAQEALAALETVLVKGDDGQQVGTRRYTTFEVSDYTKLPEAYKCLDSSRVKEAIAAGVKDIPGLIIYDKLDMVVRKRRGRGVKGG